MAWHFLISCFMLYRSNNNNCANVDCIDDLDDISQDDTCCSSNPGNEGAEAEVNGSTPVKPPKFQKGVLRTNCIDCLDRTNVAQYAYGLAALGHQLHALGSVESPELDIDSTLARHLMHFYERMGDTLALQYGGSAAHNKVPNEFYYFSSSVCQANCRFPFHPQDVWLKLGVIMINNLLLYFRVD